MYFELNLCDEIYCKFQTDISMTKYLYQRRTIIPKVFGNFDIVLHTIFSAHSPAILQ